ncbi:MAG: HAMP domain-containing histidine kinase [Anaerolineales bacterium]|nr:HAMP domain-containing histidine kinase [Anaerolineales bacterium]
MPKAIPEFPTQIDFQAFLSREAHDLKSPFNQILGFTKMILKGQDGPLTDFQREDLTTVYNSSLKALEYIRLMVEAARIGTGEKDFSLADIEVKALIEHVVADWDKNHPAQTVRLEVQVGEGITSLHVDEVQMRQALSSAIAYATAYLIGEGTITLALEKEADRVVISARSRGTLAPAPGSFEVDIHGYLLQAYVARNQGKFLAREVLEDGILLKYSVPGHS